ncbi:MAG: hypothetical protein EAZ95_04015 [Bacteroidetes bacterium]|nr:MAG: hypothetical protein EAZ95_04015 [Bacteroidota bacterium]
MAMRVFLLLFFSVFWGIATGFAQKVVTLSADSLVYPMGYRVDILEDKTQRLGFQDVLSPTAQARFLPSRTASPNDGFSPSDYWFRFRVRAGKDVSTTKQWFVQMFNSNIDTINVYILNNQNKLLKHYLSGDMRPYKQRPIDYHKFTFPLPLTLSDTLTIYIKTEGIYAKAHNLKLLERDELEREMQYKLGFLLFLFGVFAALLIYNGLLFVSLGDINYLYYILYLSSVIAYMVSQTGVGYQYLYGNYPNVSGQVSNFAALLIGIFACIFELKFLKIATILPTWVAKVTYGFVGFGVFLLAWLILTFFLPSLLLPLIFLIANYVFVAILLVLVLGIWALWKGSRQAIFFLIAFGFAIAGGLLYVLNHLGFIGSSIFTEWGMQIGTAMEVLLLSFGLADRMKIMEHEKRVAQRATIEALQENEQIIREQKELLEKKVQERTYELAETNSELATSNEELYATIELMNEQKNDIETKQKAITDSITYAKRIQEAVLPTQEEFKACQLDSFIFFLPRDIVSGDFYFLAQKQNKQIVAAIDCTGHGVPGAFMSMMGKEILEQIVLERDIVQADLILNELHRSIRKALKQKETHNHDGMDLSLIVIDSTAGKVEFAGAKNPLVYIQNQKLHTIKGDKMPIGGEQREKERIFTLHTIALLPDSPTHFYLFSDGFQDQFGGQADKKFGIAQMRNMLFAIHTQDLASQHEHLTHTFAQWLGRGKQIDDVLVLGLCV